jgi:hypothetical protein
MTLPLDCLQRWMQAVIVHPGTVDEAAADAGAQAEVPLERVGEVILPSASLSPLERMAIYHAMYPLRMEEALASDYPALKRFLGDEGFFELVRAYVQEHPSRSFTLGPLGSHLPEFVASARAVRRRAFCHELARLERAIAEVFEAPEEAALDERAILSVPARAWENARLRPIPAFRLLALRYPAGAYLDSLHDDGHRHPPIRRQDGWVAVYRRNYSVYRHDLSRPAHDLLADLAGGHTVGEAVAAALARRSRPRPQAEDLFRWFRQWAAAGMFAEVRLS